MLIISCKIYKGYMKSFRYGVQKIFQQNDAVCLYNIFEKSDSRNLYQKWRL